MPTWFIEPRDPLIVRDGRPFGADPGARARSLGFPMPSTTTGGLRSRAGLTKDQVFDKERVAEVLQIAVRGPLLAALDQEGRFAEWLPPAPADALLVRDEKNHRDQLLHLVPLDSPPGADYSRPSGGDLALIGPTVAVNKKPLAQPPRYWHWAQYVQWLTEPQSLAAHLQANTTLGIAGPMVETRTHVSIVPGTQTAEDGRLFQTSGLEFTAADQNRLVLVVESEARLPYFEKGGFAPLGGERRLMAWRPDAPQLPGCPPALRARMLAERACRVLLLTPAHFTKGYRPTWLLEAHGDVQAELVAALVQRPQVISGWDMNEGKPKPIRRLAPAGSVFFLRLPETATDSQLNDWIDAIWMQNISDDDLDDADRDRRDGFGLAILGAWDGKLRAMEVE
jgi:CRISPR-associated protein Cmr3